jgi:8-oxo-dGTP pyrophosphatase MutT (NUDIX family)
VRPDIGAASAPDHLPVSVLARGSFDERAVSVVDDDQGQPRGLDDAAIAARWEAHADAVRRQGRRPRNDELLRLSAVVPTPDRLSLVLGRTDYRQFVGTRTGVALAEPLHSDGLANPLGTSVVAVTADEHVLVARRPLDSDINPGRWFLVGGFLEPSDLTDGGGVFGGAEREVREELGLDAQDVSGTRCTGLVYDEVVLHPELCFTTSLGLDLDDVRRRRGDGELSAVEGAPADADGLRSWLVAEGSMVVPTAAASVLLYGRNRFGRSWYDDAARSVGGLG